MFLGVYEVDFMMRDSNDVTSSHFSSDLSDTVQNQSSPFYENTLVCSQSALSKAGRFLLMTYKSPKKNGKTWKIFSVV